MQKETEDRLRATIIKPARRVFQLDMDVDSDAVNAGFIFGIIAFLSGIVISIVVL